MFFISFHFVLCRSSLLERARSDNSALAAQLHAMEHRVSELMECIDPEGSISVDDLFEVSSQQHDRDRERSRLIDADETGRDRDRDSSQMSSPAALASPLMHTGSQSGGHAPAIVPPAPDREGSGTPPGRPSGLA